MFRSDKKPIIKAVVDENTSYEKPLQSWQQTTPPVEEDVTLRTVPVQPPEQPRAFTERDAMARDIKDGVLNGFVGSGTAMAGEAVFKGMLRIDGILTGRITSEDGTLLVGTDGQVDADVNVCIATVHGTVNGDIIASKRIELGRSARVLGNIQTPALVIEQGAVFEGSCTMLQPNKVADKQFIEKEAKITRSSVRQPTELALVSETPNIAS